jgi:hypothetical protein
MDDACILEEYGGLQVGTDGHQIAECLSEPGGVTRSQHRRAAFFFEKKELQKRHRQKIRGGLMHGGPCARVCGRGPVWGVFPKSDTSHVGHFLEKRLTTHRVVGSSCADSLPVMRYNPRSGFFFVPTRKTPFSERFLRFGRVFWGLGRYALACSLPFVFLDVTLDSSFICHFFRPGGSKTADAAPGSHGARKMWAIAHLASLWLDASQVSNVFAWIPLWLHVFA